MALEGEILYFHHKTHEPIEDFLGHYRREHLKVGKTIGNKIRGRTTRRYTITFIDDGYMTRVVLKPVKFTHWDLLQLLIIAALVWYVADMLFPLYFQ